MDTNKEVHGEFMVAAICCCIVRVSNTNFSGNEIWSLIHTLRALP